MEPVTVGNPSTPDASDITQSLFTKYHTFPPYFTDIVATMSFFNNCRVYTLFLAVTLLYSAAASAGDSAKMPAPAPATADQECIIPLNKQGVADDGEGLPVIRVRVTNVESAEGNLMFSLYDDNPDTFMKYKTYLKKLHAPAQKDETIVCIRAPAKGEFAVTVYHDEDEDRDFDRNLFGFPKEGYGFSNNPKIRFPLPRHKDVKFAVVEDETDIEIVLHY